MKKLKKFKDIYKLSNRYVAVKVFKDGEWLTYAYKVKVKKFGPNYKKNLEIEKQNVVKFFKEQNKNDKANYIKPKIWQLNYPDPPGEYTYPVFKKGKYKMMSWKLFISFRDLPTNEEYYKSFRDRIGSALTHSKIENYKARCKYYNIPIDQSKIDKWESLYK